MGGSIQVLEFGFQVLELKRLSSACQSSVFEELRVSRGQVFSLRKGLGFRAWGLGFRV